MLHVCKKIICTSKSSRAVNKLFAANFQISDEDNNCKPQDGTTFIMCTPEFNNEKAKCEGPLKKVM
jgi:hypothetical protein